MRSVSASELLGVWEQGLAQRPVQRALTLLTTACPETSPEELAKLSIGQRDARLLTLREWTFGPQLIGLAICPTCGQRLELTFNVADIQVASEVEPKETLALCVADYEVHFRPPNSLDLAAIADQKDVAAGQQRLLENCLMAVHQNGEQVSADQLPANIREAVVEQMARADPQADVQLALSCPSCGHQWQAAFDIVSFFWSEINAWASRILREVHTLASAYGWREADILAMSPWRRQCYLEMLSG
jgi:uncharacterized protein (UPF0212 family)